MIKIRILLIEDNRLLRDGITRMIKKQHDMIMAAIDSNSENILQLMKKFKPDILLLDPGLRKLNGLKIVKLSKQNFPVIKILIMDLIPFQNDVYDFVQAGVSGFILKDANLNEFYKTIRSVYRGIQVLPPYLTESLFSQIIEFSKKESKSSTISDSVKLTKRECQIMKLVSDSCTNKEIAQYLKISTFTVKSHMHNILEKLSLHTRVQIAKYYHNSDLSKIELIPNLFED